MSSVHFVTSGFKPDFDPEYDHIRDKLTPEFAETLAECARIFGWSGDYNEIVSFVETCIYESGVDPRKVDLDPH